MNAMAASLFGEDFDPSDYELTTEDSLRLWARIDEAIRGGVMHTNEVLKDDPFAVFVTARCTNHAMHPKGMDHEYIAVVKTGYKAGREEAERILAFMKNEENVATCEVCKHKVDVWSVESTRMSTFAAKDKARAATEIMRLT